MRKPILALGYVTILLGIFTLAHQRDQAVERAWAWHNVATQCDLK
jgi:hypothetical protein